MELIFDGAAPSGKAADLMKEAAEMCLEREGVRSEDTEVSVTFVGLEEIKEINKEFRNIDSSTDVLSFPQFNDPQEIPAEGRISIGDVVICTEQALLQAEEFGHSEDRELVYLFVHSIFHLLGYDHMNDDDKAEMRAAEEDIMSKIGLERQ
ncbi:MAG: rRNA maturation RNase YbeY [Eubacteriaceae bacterium]|jgi:probable rRNA maturation factor|nr:rRNA maturation RNase YbeY [Eubacteriaceae bacterium]